MALLQELDTGTPIRTGEATVTLTIDGRQGERLSGDIGHGRRGSDRQSDPQTLRDGQCGGLRILPPLPVEIEGRKGTPASCTTPAEAGMNVRTRRRASSGCAAASWSFTFPTIRSTA